MSGESRLRYRVIFEALQSYAAKVLDRHLDEAIQCCTCTNSYNRQSVEEWLNRASIIRGI